MRYLIFLALFVSPPLGSILNAAEVCYLSWQNDPTTTMTIRWLTDLKTTSDEIEIKKPQEESWKKVAGTHKALPYDAPHFLHTVEATALEPDTSYQFRLPGETETHLFRTMPATLTKPVRFASGGDAYHDTVEPFEEMCKKIASYSPRFILLGGDIAYSVHTKRSGDDKFDRWFTFLQSWTRCMKDSDGNMIPILTAIGNHEVKGYYNQTPDQAKFYYSFFGPNSYKQLLFGKYLALTILDSNHTHPIAGEQTTWLQQSLRTAYSYPHRFAVYHVPAYPSVRYFRIRESCAIRKHWVPLFERYSVQAVFENHEHAYKRTHPLVKDEEHPDGVVYFGDGSWGVKPRPPKKAWRTSYLAKTESARQFLLVELTNENRTFTATDITGKTIDSYSQKVAPPEKF
ncbi:MAG: metallophosphoesterase family protein [Verrucomicrobia bacterium]|nr:metallophosphoesterase family protein [Verrucomicrobiota bacterium]MBS0636811.1 metallophosphoesterase family protein [Verrucomicrobiota bacterium]